MEAAPQLTFVFLAQPWTELAAVEATLGIEAEHIAGWTAETIAKLFANECVPINPADADRIKNLTGGVPLFVRSSVGIVRESYGGNVGRYCQDLETASAFADSAQQIVVEQAIAQFSDEAEQLLALLGLSWTPLSVAESRDLFGRATRIGVQDQASGMRELSRSGILQRRQDGKLTIHNGFRQLAQQMGEKDFPDVLAAGRLVLIGIIKDSFPTADAARFATFLRLLADTKQAAVLADLADDEFFHESGIAPDIRERLEQLALEEGLELEPKFQALDALAWMSNRDGNLDELRRVVSGMEELEPSLEAGSRERKTLKLRQMTLAAQDRDAVRLQRLYKEAVRLAKADPQSLLVIDYTRATALYALGQFDEAEQQADRVADRYLSALGLTYRDIFAANPPELKARLGPKMDMVAEIKHLADSWDLYCKARARQGKEPGVSVLFAFKFYAMVGAFRSAVKLGQDVVDLLIRVLADPFEARKVISETLLPGVIEFRLFEYVVPVRAQFAVVHAYCGDFTEAAAELAAIQPFEQALTPEEILELESQKTLISKIEHGEIRLGPPKLLPPNLKGPVADPGRPTMRKVGRNEPCPCGSDKKFKKCHGN